MFDISIHENVLPLSQFNDLRRASLSHPMISETTLNQRFKQTRGFAVIFRQDGLEKTLSIFPFLEPFLKLIGATDSAFELENIHDFQQPLMKAYYLNLLLISSGGDVGRHVDATLMKPIGIPDLTPSRVSVLFLQCPRFTIGGRLNVYRKNNKKKVIEPNENKLIVFRGDFPHAVSPFRTFSQKPRASLVCESYLAPKANVMKLQPFNIVAKADFSTHLALAKAAIK